MSFALASATTILTWHLLGNPRLQYADRVALLESRDLISRVFHSLHGRSLSATKAGEILAYLQQGRAYLAASESADEVIRPLLQYYSVLAYARGYILIQEPVLREASLAQAHGLSALGWKEHFDSGGQWLDARLKVGKGTFAQIAATTRNVNFVEVPHPSGKRLLLAAAGSAQFPEGYEFRVRDVLARMPSLADLYEAIVEERAACWRLRMFNMDDYLDLEITANSEGLPSAEDVVATMSLGRAEELVGETQGYPGWGPTKVWQFPLPLDDLPALNTHLSNVRMYSGSAYLVSPLAQGVRLSRLSTVFATSYALGMLVRYFPTQWAGLLSRHKGDQVLPLVRAASDAVKTFPELVTEAIGNAESLRGAD